MPAVASVIHSDPEILSGAPVFLGTRVPLRYLIDYLAAGDSLEKLLDALPMLPFGLPEARRHAELWAELSRTGNAIGPHDLLIAATALAQGHALVTLNQREFGRVPGLRLVATERYLS